MAKLLQLDTATYNDIKHTLPHGWGDLFRAKEGEPKADLGFTRQLFESPSNRTAHGEIWTKVPKEGCQTLKVMAGQFEIECTRHALEVIKNGQKLWITPDHKITLNAGDIFTLSAPSDAVYFVKSHAGTIQKSPTPMPELKPVPILPFSEQPNRRSATATPAEARSSRGYARSKAG